MVHEFGPTSVSVLTACSLLGIFSPCLSLSLSLSPLTHCFLKINKLKKNNIKILQSYSGPQRSSPSSSTRVIKSSVIRHPTPPNLSSLPFHYLHLKPSLPPPTTYTVSRSSCRVLVSQSPGMCPGCSISLSPHLYQLSPFPQANVCLYSRGLSLDILYSGRSLCLIPQVFLNASFRCSITPFPYPCIGKFNYWSFPLDHKFSKSRVHVQFTQHGIPSAQHMNEWRPQRYEKQYLTWVWRSLPSKGKNTDMYARVYIIVFPRCFWVLLAAVIPIEVRRHLVSFCRRWGSC